MNFVLLTVCVFIVLQIPWGNSPNETVVQAIESMFIDGISVSYATMSHDDNGPEEEKQLSHAQLGADRPTCIGTYSTLPGHSGGAIMLAGKLREFREANHGHFPLWSMRQ